MLTERHNLQRLTAEAHETPPRSRGPSLPHWDIPAQAESEISPHRTPVLARGALNLPPRYETSSAVSGARTPSSDRAERDKGILLGDIFNSPPDQIPPSSGEPPRHRQRTARPGRPGGGSPEGPGDPHGGSKPRHTRGDRRGPASPGPLPRCPQRADSTGVARPRPRQPGGRCPEGPAKRPGTRHHAAKPLPGTGAE